MVRVCCARTLKESKRSFPISDKQSSAIFLGKKNGDRMDVFIDYQKQGPFRDLIRYFLKYFLSAFTMMRSSVHFKIGSNPCLLCFKDRECCFDHALLCLFGS